MADGLVSTGAALIGGLSLRGLVAARGGTLR